MNTTQTLTWVRAIIILPDSPFIFVIIMMSILSSTLRIAASLSGREPTNKSCLSIKTLAFCTAFFIQIVAVKVQEQQSGGTITSDIPAIVEHARQNLRFEKNIGQMDNAAVRFKATDAQATYFFSQNEFRSVVSSKDSLLTAYSVQFLGTNSGTMVEGVGRSNTRFGQKNYINESGTFANVPSFNRLFYKDLWSGVDVLFYESKDGSMEYDFLLQPGADPGQVRFRLEGAQNVRVNDRGELAFTMPFGTLQKGKPLTYQIVEGKQVEVPCEYVVENGEVSFRLAKYDPSEALVIDPIALKWSTYLMAGASTFRDIFVHPTTGRIYLVGYTSNPSFPNTLGRPFGGGASDVFVTCMEKDGTSIVWSTFLGGSGVDVGMALHVDAAGDVYVNGLTRSLDFPLGSTAPYDAVGDAVQADIFVARLNSTGTTVKYSTYLGANGGQEEDGYDQWRKMFVENGVVYFGSSTRGSNYPTTPDAFQATVTGNSIRAVFTILNTNVGGNTGLVYSTYFGVPSNVVSRSAFTEMAQDKDGNFWFVGTAILQPEFPVSANAVQKYADFNVGVIITRRAAFVAKFSKSGQYLYSSYACPFWSLTNGAGVTEVPSIDLDAQGNVYVVAATDPQATPATLQKAPNIVAYHELSLLSGLQENTTLDFGYLAKIPYNLSPQYDFVSIFPSNADDDYADPEVAVDKKGNIHLFTKGGSYGGNAYHPITPGAANSNIYNPFSAPTIYYVLPPSGNSVLYGSVLNSHAGSSFFGMAVNDKCEAYIVTDVHSYTTFENNYPITPSYRDFESNSQKSVYNSTTNTGYALTVFHEPKPNNNSITNFAPGNNTFCIGGAIWQNPNDGPIVGSKPSFLSGDGSSPTHNLPNIRYNLGPITAHPTPTTPALKYQWQKRLNGGAWTNVGDGTFELYKPQPETAAGTVDYRRLVLGYCGDTLSISNMASATIAGTFNLQINVPSDVVYYCSGTAQPLGITVTAASGNISWQWYDGFAPLTAATITPASDSGVAAGSFTASLSSAFSGNGFFRLVVTDAGGCRREMFVAVAPKVENAGSAPSLSLCPGASTSIALGPTSANPLFDYAWTGPSGFTSTNPNPIVTVAGTYTLQVKLKTDASFCSPGTTVSVTAATAHSASLTALLDKQFCQADSPAGIGLGASPPSGYVFQWVPGMNLDNQVAFNPQFDPGVVPANGFPVGTIEYTFSALRLSDGCIYEDKIIVSDTARALAQAGIDKPACGSDPSAVFGAPETQGNFFQWRAVATTYPGGVAALTSHPKFKMDGVATNLGTNKFLTAHFPDHSACYSIDYEIIGSYIAITGSSCLTRDTARLFYCPTCITGSWCSDLTSNALGVAGACAGNENWIGGESLSGLTYTWETHSVNGVVQSGSNREPRGLYYLNNDSTKGAQLPFSGAHPSKAIADFDNATWGWPGANVVIYRLRSNGNFGDGVIDCHRDIQVFSAANAVQAIGIKDLSLCSISAPGIRFGATGNAGPYAVSGIDYTQAPNSAFNWTWTGLNGQSSATITTGVNTRFPTLNPTVSTSYIVKAQDPATGCFAKDTMNVLVREVVANAGWDLSNVCPGSVVQLGTAASPNQTYSWSPASGLNFPVGTTNNTVAQPFLTVPNTPTPPAALTYTVTVTDNVTGCQATDNVVINTSNTAPPALAAATYNACPGSSFIIGPSSSMVGATYQWAVQGGTANLAWLGSTTERLPRVTLPANFTGPAVFRLTMTKGSCGTVFADYIINDNNPAMVLASPIAASCAAPYTQLGEAPLDNHNYSWSPTTGLYGNSTLTSPYTGWPAQPWVLVTEPTTYTVTRTSYLTGCVQTATVTVNPPAGVSVNAGADKKYCQGSSAISIGATGSGTLSWEAIGYTTNTQIVQPPTSIAAPMTDANMLSFIGGSANAATRTFPASGIPPAGAYAYRVTSSNGGCSVSDIVMVIVANVPTGVAGLGTAVCPGETVRLGASTNPTSLTYNWTVLSPSTASGTIDDPTAARPFVAPSVTTTYQVVYTDAAKGCSADEQVTVAVNPRSNVADVSMPIACAPISAVNLTSQVPGYGSLVNPLWYRGFYPGGTLVATPSSVTPTATTDYFLVSENTSGCTDTARITVNVANPQTPNILPSATVPCGSSTFDLASVQGTTSSPGHVFEWHSANNSLASSLLPSTVVSTSGTYYLFEKAPSPANCFSASDNIVVSFPTNLTASISGNTNLCGVGGSTTLTASGTGTSYLWSTGATTPSITVSPKSTTTYSVTATGAGCPAVASVIVMAGICPEDCVNGTDDDGDGLVDCSDSDCVPAVLPSEATAAQFRTIADGSFTDPTIWAGGVTPATGDINNQIISIEHDVTLNGYPIKLINNSKIFVSNGSLSLTGGGLTIEVGTVTLNKARLVIPSSQNLELTTAQARFYANDASIACGQNFQSSAGRRVLRNVCISVYENYYNTGGTDTLINVCLTAGISTSGSFSNSGQMYISNSSVDLPNGNFVNTSSGNIRGNALNIRASNGNLTNSGTWTAQVSNYCVSGTVAMPVAYLPASENCGGIATVMANCNCDCFGPEYCNDGIDNDGDGFVDATDTDCHVCPTVSNPGACNNNQLVNSTFEDGTFVNDGNFVGSPAMNMAPWVEAPANYSADLGGKWVNATTTGHSVDGSCHLVWMEASTATSGLPDCVYQVQPASGSAFQWQSLVPGQCYEVSAWVAPFHPNAPNGPATLSFDFAVGTGSDLPFLVLDEISGGTLETNSSYNYKGAKITLNATTLAKDLLGNNFTDPATQALHWGSLAWRKVVVKFHVDASMSVKPNFSVSGTTGGVAFDNVFFGTCCPENCANGIDDDGDGLDDATDADCTGICSLGLSASSMICDNGMVVMNVAASWGGNGNGSLTLTSGGASQTFNLANFNTPEVFTITAPNPNANTILVSCSITAGTASCSGTVSIANTCREICNDGFDNDLDGLVDCADANCGPSVNVPSITICSGTSSQLNAVATGGVLPNTFNWSNGLGTSATPNVNPSATITYAVTVTSSSGCSTTGSATVNLVACPENCTNGIDDDGDGLMDCTDPNCQPSATAATVNCNATTADIDLTASGISPMSYRWSDMPAGALWYFNNNTNDASGNGRHQTALTGTAAYDASDKVEGSHSFNFNGATFIRFGVDGGFLETAYSARTYSLWVKPANLTGIKILFEQGGSAAGLACRLNGSNLSATYRITATQQFTTGTLTFPNDGAWHHVAVVFANGTLTCYLDGVPSTSANSSNTTIPANGNNDALGARNGTDAFGSSAANFYSGKMDDVRLYNLALTARQVADLARNDGDRRTLLAGTYTVTITSPVGCSAQQSVVVNPPCIEVCSDGTDNDGDGLVDCADPSCNAPAILSVTDANPSNCPSLNNGSIVITASGSNLEYSINGGANYQASGTFSNLQQGNYSIRIRNTVSGCTADYTGNLVVLTASACQENCTNGSDDDGDGLADCADADCRPVASAGTGVSICSGQSVALTATAIGGTAPYSFNWSNGLGSGNTKTVSPSSTSSYIVTVTTTGGCTATAGVTVTVSNCTEVCADGLDNDGDGLVDCSDPDCATIGTPSLANDAFTTCPGVALQGIVTMNDGNLQNPVITVQVPPTQGSVVINNFGAFTYTPSSSNCGSDQFTYRACNASGCCATAVATIIIGDNVPPTLLNVPADLTIACDDEVPLPPLVVGQDACPVISISFDEQTTQASAGACFSYAITRTWVTTDVCGNSAIDSQLITVIDDVQPELFRVYTLANGKKMVAGIAENTSNLWKYVKFPVAFSSTPLVFAQITSDHEPTPANVQVRYVTNGGFQVRISEEEAANGLHIGESVSWMAIEPGNLNGAVQLAAQTVNAVNHNVQTLNFPFGFASKPAILACAQTTNEMDPFTIRTSSETATGFSLRLQEEQSADTETSHLNEKLGYLAISNASILYDASGSVVGESGTVSTKATWTTVNLAYDYTKPVVLFGGLTSHDLQSAVVQVRNVTPSSFEVRVQEWSYLDGAHANESLGYFVVEGSIPNSSLFYCENGSTALEPGEGLVIRDNCDEFASLSHSALVGYLPIGRITTQTWSATDACGNQYQITRTDTCNVAAVQLRAALAGAFVGTATTNSLMSAELMPKQLVPREEPYSAIGGFVQKGMGGGEVASSAVFSATGPNAITDWVFLECRAASNPEEILSTCSALLLRDGRIVAPDGGNTIYFWDLPNGDYHVVLRHRNHLGLMTDYAWNLDAEAPPVLDFTLSSTTVKGGVFARKPVNGGKLAMWAGDFNGDGKAIYQGPYNDVFFLFSKVLADPDNLDFLANFIALGYNRPDANLDGKSIYQGPNNDRSMLLLNTVLSYGGNSSLLANYIVLQWLP
jgi:hypothetical protein